MGRFVIFFILLSLLAGSATWARVDVSSMKKMEMPTAQDSDTFSKDFAERVRPKNVQGNEGSAVFSKMADNTLAYWWDTTPLRRTQFGQAADAVEKKARLQGKIEGANKVTHTFDLKVLVMQALARFEYKGWVRAGVNYDARAATTEAEIIQPLTPGKDLVVSQQFNKSESTSRLSFQFDW